MGFSKFLTSLTDNREKVNQRSQPMNAELQQGSYYLDKRRQMSMRMKPNLRLIEAFTSEPPPPGAGGGGVGPPSTWGGGAPAPPRTGGGGGGQGGGRSVAGTRRRRRTTGSAGRPHRATTGR